MAESDNLSNQIDEIEALSAIYEDDWKVVDESAKKFSITVKSGSDQSSLSATLEVIFLPDYPSDSPPMYQLSMPWLRGEKKLDVDNALNDIYLENRGENIIYLWVEKIREYVLEEIADPLKHDSQVEYEEEEEVNWNPSGDFTENTTEHNNPLEDRLKCEDTECECPEIYHGEFLTDRKSKFQAHLAAVIHKDQVKLILDKLCENKKIAAATHNIYAFRIYTENPGKSPLIYQGCEDDGEIHAGNRMLHLMQIIDCQNVMVIVTRWYGGIHLGPDRFKHINSLTRIILEQHGYIKDTKKDKRAGKKK